MSSIAHLVRCHWIRNKLEPSFPDNLQASLIPDANVHFSPQTSHPSSPLPSHWEPSSTTLHPSPSSAPSSATHTTVHKLPTPRRSSSSRRRLHPPLPHGELLSLVAPFRLMVLVLSSTPLVLSATRVPHILVL